MIESPASRRYGIEGAPSRPARALWMAEKVGTLEADKVADPVVVNGNPREDLSALANLGMGVTRFVT